MDSLANRKHSFRKLSGYRQPVLSFMASRQLHRFVLYSIVWFLGTLAGGISAVEPQSASEPAVLGDGRLVGYARLREGTRIPATLGTVVALGPRRWAFVPAAAPVKRLIQSVTESELVEMTGARQGGTVTRSIDSLTLSTKISSTGGGLPRRGDAGLLKDTVGAESEQSNSVPVVLIAENLMLQRIVQAIREDELDNLWQVTGRVTEYFGENRLTILTAQRGQAKQLPPATDR